MDVQTLRAFITTHFPQVCDEVHLEHVAPMTARLRLRVQQRHLRPGGTVSGPAMFMLADVAFYLAVLAMIGPKALTVTTNLNINFLRKPAAGADLLCDARILKLGKLLATGDALLFSEGDGAPVAHAAMTYAIPPE